MLQYFDMVVQFAQEQPLWFAGSIAAGVVPIGLIFVLCGGLSGGAASKPASAKTAAKKKDDDASSPDSDSDKENEKPVIGSEAKAESETPKDSTTLRKRKN